MRVLNTIIKLTQAYIAIKICVILYMIHSNPKHHSIDEVLWWVSVLILDMWLNLIVLSNIKLNTEPEKEKE